MKKTAFILLAVLLAGTALFAQRRIFRGEGDYEAARTPRELPQRANVTPDWTNAPGFDADVFTFARIIRGYSGRNDGGPWWVDTPDSDLNLSYRLQQITSMRVNPEGLFLRLTDPELLRYPFIYMVEPGSLHLTDQEVAALRRYLLNGGFLMLDDFWGEAEWNGMAQELRKVFPDRDWVELPLDHPVYRSVFNIKAKGQIPNVQTGTLSRQTGVTWEKGGREVHHRVLLDDKGRIMAIALHNTDNGDGWEWEANNHYYFEQFSEKIAYPLAVNIIFYSMTH